MSYVGRIETRRMRRYDGGYAFELYFNEPALVVTEDPETLEVESRLRAPDATLTEEVANQLVMDWLRGPSGPPGPTGATGASA